MNKRIKTSYFLKFGVMVGTKQPNPNRRIKHYNRDILTWKNIHDKQLDSNL